MAEPTLGTRPNQLTAAEGPQSPDAPAEGADEQLTVVVRRDMEALHRQAYRSLGWTVRDLRPARPGSVAMEFTRNSRVRNRGTLLQLQKQSDRALRVIDELDTTATQAAGIRAVATATLGMALLAGAILSGTAGLATVSLLLGLAAFAAMLLPPVIYAGVRAKRAFLSVPLVDDQLDILRAACQQADTARR